MKRELEQKLVDRFPKFFREYRGDPRKTCMSFGIEHGDGWYSIIEKLCLYVEEVLTPEDDFWFLQIKEKFGTLRVYFSGPERIRPLIESAEAESTVTCESCGTVRDVLMTTFQGWCKNKCVECWDKEADERGVPHFAYDRLSLQRLTKKCSQDEE